MSKANLEGNTKQMKTDDKREPRNVAGDSPMEQSFFVHSCMTIIDGFLLGRPYFSVNSSEGVSMSFKVQIRSTNYSVVVDDHSLMLKFIQDYKNVREVQVCGPISLAI